MDGVHVLAARIGAAEARRATERFCFMEEQKIKKALAPRTWQALGNNLKQQAKRIGEVSPLRIVVEERGFDLRLINADTGRGVVLSYNSDVPCIHFDFDGFEGGGYWPFKVSGDGTIVLLFDPKRNVVISDLDSLAIEIIRSLVG